jgi:uncharacterized membrane protein YgcG
MAADAATGRVTGRNIRLHDARAAGAGARPVTVRRRSLWTVAGRASKLGVSSIDAKRWAMQAHRGRTLWALGAVLLTAALMLGSATAAYAEDPVDFGSSHIADKVGALADRGPEVQSALDSLYADTRIDLYVVYVDSFSRPSDRQQWAADTANRNGMGINDVLLAVATGARQYQLSVDPGFQLTDAQIAEVGTNAVEPALRENDWAGAGIGAAEGLAASVNGTAVTAPDITPGAATPSGGGSSGSGWGFLWVLIVAVLVIGAIIFFVARRRVSTGSTTGAGVPSGPPPVPTAEFKRRAGSALVQTDDAIKTSEQELGFAIAQYGSDAAEPFRAALDTAKEHLTRAFTLQQKLDDAVPDTEEQVRAWYAEIIDLCEKSNATLDEQSEAFDQLRELEKNASGAAASVAAEFAGLNQRIGQAESQLASLAQGYTPASIATVADNPAQARERLAFAQATLAEANGKLSSGDSGTAAVGIRAAEDATDQAKLLLDAIDRLAADLQKAAQGVTATIADLETDLVTARALPSGSPSGAGPAAGPGAAASVPAVIATTEQAIADAKGKLAAGPINPLDLVRTLEAANTQMDTMLAGVRDAQAQAQRAQAALGQTMLSARSQVSAAEDFITARRGAVGAEARTRLAEAGRLLIQADSLAQSDPAAALAVASRADSLGAEAIQLAQNDVSGFGGAGMGGGMFGGGTGTGGGGNGMMGAILGGIIINSVLGGGGGTFGGGGGTFGGGGGMFGGGGGGRRGGGGGFGSAGSFGGSGTRSRRGGGGRF